MGNHKPHSCVTSVGLATSLLVLFLASSAASFSTGSEFLVDGALLLGPALARGPLVTSAA
jgi:hypothetical protein